MDSPHFHFDPAALDALAETHREGYASATPFRHVVLDNFVPMSVIAQIRAELPPLENVGSFDIAPTIQAERGKTAVIAPDFFGPRTTSLLYQLNSHVMLNFLEKLTGIDALISDTRLEGGGYHLTRRGGRLGVHTDFSHHRVWKLRRRLNIILYLNDDWHEEYGGHLELWDKALTGVQSKVLPIAGRCVIFNTDQDSPHGQPDPLMCPPERGRQSLALYYYDNPAEQMATIDTKYMLRPSEQRTAKSIVKKLLPPILLDLRNALKRSM